MQLGGQVNCKFQAKMVWREKYLAELTENYKLLTFSILKKQHQIWGTCFFFEIAANLLLKRY